MEKTESKQNTHSEILLAQDHPLAEMPQQQALRYIRIRKYKVRVPNTPGKRLLLGTSLTIVGIFPGPPGPVVSVVGLTILSIDYPKLRRARRKGTVWLGRRTWAKNQKRQTDDVAE